VFPLELLTKNPELIKALIERSKQNDLAAFEQLVKIYQHRVYGLCYQLAGNYNDAQDLAQEVFIQAYSSINSFRNESDLGTWLHRIAVNKWINIQRKNKRNNIVSIDAPLNTDKGELQREVPSPNGNPQDILEEKEYHDLVKKALQLISYEHRTVLFLREVQGYSYEEIAGIIDCSVGTVRSRLNRARKNLKDKVEQLVQKV